jgi:hypothetical protein
VLFSKYDTIYHENLPIVYKQKSSISRESFATAQLSTHSDLFEIASRRKKARKSKTLKSTGALTECPQRSRVRESPPFPHHIGQLPKQQLHINVKIELI